MSPANSLRAAAGLMELTRVSRSDGSWIRLCRQWEQECTDFNENFGEFASASFPVLDILARGPLLARAGVFAVSGDGGYSAACHVDVCQVTGCEGEALRVRLITFSPRFDLDDGLSLDDYARTLVRVFAGAVGLSCDAIPVRHIRFQLRSPAERQFADLFDEALDGLGTFQDLVMRGAWIHLSKSGSTRKRKASYRTRGGKATRTGEPR